MIRTLIVEESGIARLGLRSILASLAIALEIDETAGGADLMPKLRARYYEFIIVEPALSGGADATLVRRLCEASPWSPVLVFTELDELVHGVDAIRSGARGYLMKSASRDEIHAAVRRVVRGQLYLGKALAAAFAAGVRKYDIRTKPHEIFNRREFEVFAMAVCGMTTVESAQVLQMRLDAIGALKRRVMARLQAATPHDLAVYAASHGLVHECRSTSSMLWSERYDQDCMERLVPAPAPARRAATQPGRSAAIIGRDRP